MSDKRWLHRRSWIRHGSPLWAVALMVDAAVWLGERLTPWRGWNVWTTTECESCGSRYKVTSGKPRNRVRQWIVVRFGR